MVPSQLASEFVREAAYRPSAATLDSYQLRSASQGCCLPAQRMLSDRRGARQSRKEPGWVANPARQAGQRPSLVAATWWQHRPFCIVTRTGVTRYLQRSDVVIIGGGITGAAAAYELAGAGVGVTLVDKGDLASMASGWTLAGVRQSGRHPSELLLAMVAVQPMRAAPVNRCSAGSLIE